MHILAWALVAAVIALWAHVEGRRWMAGKAAGMDTENGEHT